ncbi:MAG: hypothetical protein IJ192_03750 [Clostridia bacterium]|nr:hypothetical protein [Clostridia bacterium]MBR2175807.1 hypothetical protein [Clostridia bacterium]
MSKKIMIILFSCLLTLTLITGCNNNGNTSDTEMIEKSVSEESVAVNEISQDEDESSSVNKADEKAESEISAQDTNNQIDVDLTTLSSTMVYSEVYNIIYNPDDYRGKRIKMTGLFNSYYYDTTDKYYFACVIPDATACCAQGIEFKLDDNYSYPDDYPAEGTEITIIGTFSTYKEGSFEYCILKNASLV